MQEPLTSGAPANPVSRVVELLQDLSKQVEQEGKKEEAGERRDGHEDKTIAAKITIETANVTSAHANQGAIFKRKAQVVCIQEHSMTPTMLKDFRAEAKNTQ